MTGMLASSVCDAATILEEAGPFFPFTIRGRFTDDVPGDDPWDDTRSTTHDWKTFELTSSVPITIDVQEEHKEWVVLGQVDLDAFVESHVATAAGFEENFRAVRAKRKEADKLPETVKVLWVLRYFGRSPIWLEAPPRLETGSRAGRCHWG